MSRRENGAYRCERCRMLGGLCVCGLVPALEIASRLVVVVHRDEVRKPTNTGVLAAACVVGSEVIVRGREGARDAPIEIAAGTRPVVMFPADDAVVLTRETGPVTLIVPDGTWRQAQRVRARVPGLKDVPCVVLPPGPPTRYRLRSESREGGLATMEAIARALGVLEAPHVQAAIERVFDAMVERTLWSRGMIGADAVTGGVPEGVERDDPRGARRAGAR